MKQVLFALIVLLSAGYWLAAESPAQSPAGEPRPNGGKPDDPQGPPVGDIYQKTKEIYSAIEKLESGSIPEQQDGFDKLRAMGPAVLPFLAAHLKEKAVFLELTRQIIEQGLSKGHAAGTFTAPLYNITKSFGTNAAFIEKYFYGRYLGALKLFEQENYNEAKELAMAILTIEKNLSFRNQLQLLKIQCEERIIQAGVLRAALTARPRAELPAGLYESTDRVNLTLKLENVSLVPIEIDFGADNIIALNVISNLYDPFGSFNNKMRTELIPLKVETLKLNPNEKKEWEFTLEIARDNPDSPFYKTYMLYAEISPRNIKSEALEKRIGMLQSIRKIVSTNINLRVFPPEVGPVLKNPLGKLEAAIKGGVPLDIFLCSLLVPEPEQAQAIELLIKALEKPPRNNRDSVATPPAERSGVPTPSGPQTGSGIEISPQVWDTVIMNCLKHITNLPFEINKSTWLEWFRQRQQPNPVREKKK
jgi:tetratricopeptide (TPR) repeat protein